MSKKVLGKIELLFVSIKNIGREQRQSISLEEDGVIDDKFYAQGIERSVLLASMDSYKLALKNDIVVEYGLLGENILFDFNPYQLRSGDRLEIGDVVLEITQNCTICNSLGKVDSKLPNLLQSDRGIFSKTIKSGTIRIGDKVNLL